MQHSPKVVDKFKKMQRPRVRMVIRGNAAIYGGACDKQLRRYLEGFFNIGRAGL